MIFHEATGRQFKILLDKIKNIISGTTQVGDSAKLGGKGAEEYAEVADLANYFKNTGGILTGDLKVERNQIARVQICDTSEAYGQKRLHSFQNSADANNLPVTLIANINTDDSSELSAVVLKPEYATLANILSLRVSRGDATSFYPLLHTGNKPSGSYTGNGDATARNISTGGLVTPMRMIYIYCGDLGTNALVTGAGILCWKYSGNAVETLPMQHGEVSADGVLIVKSTSEYLNSSGYTYGWRVL